MQRQAMQRQGMAPASAAPADLVAPGASQVVRPGQMPGGARFVGAGQAPAGAQFVVGQGAPAGGQIAAGQAQLPAPAGAPPGGWQPFDVEPVKGQVDITVDASGQVFMRGVVTSEEAGREIEAAVRSVPGVSRVFTQFQVLARRGGDENPPPREGDPVEPRRAPAGEAPPPPPQPAVMPDEPEAKAAARARAKASPCGGPVGAG